MNVTEVLYLALKNDGSVSTGAQLDNTTLATLAQENATRLVQIVRAMESGQSLPAWGDNTTCGWCDMSLLCRRLAWME